MIRYPHLSEVLEIHRRQMVRYGGAEGIRVQNLLESVLARSQSGYYPDLIAEAPHGGRARLKTIRLRMVTSGPHLRRCMSFLR